MKQTTKFPSSNPTALEIAILAIMAAFAVVGSVLLGIGILLAFNFVPWLLWNHAVAPTFHLPAVGFWPLFGILWFVAIVGNRLFPSETKRTGKP